MVVFLLLTIGFLFLFIVLLFVGISQKKRKPIYIGLIFFLLAIPAGLYTSFLFARQAYKAISSGKVKISNPLKRSGMDIYIALLNKPTENCVTVINSQDHFIPRVDCCIWLEFKTCPNEIERIIATKKLTPTFITHTTHSRDSTLEAIVEIDKSPEYIPKPEWFKPGSLGEGYQIMRKHSQNDPNHHLILYFSKDSTRAYYCDLAE